MGYLYGGNTGIKSAAELQREREIVDALIARGGRTPQNLGEGLSTLGQAIASRIRRKRLEGDEGAAKEAGAGLMAQLFPEQPDSPTITPQSEIQTGPLGGGMSTYQPEPSLAGSPYPTSGPETPPGPADWQQGDVAQPFPKTENTLEHMNADQLGRFMADPRYEHLPPMVQQMVLKRYEALHPDPLKPTTDMQNYEYGLKNPGFLESQQSGAEYGLQPIVTQDADGKYHLYQASKAGGPPKEIQLPHGWTPKNQFLDVGTGYQPMPTQGVPQPQAQPIPKNLEEEAALKKLGGEVGDARAAYNSMSSKMPGLEKVVNDLGVLADKATFTTAGQLYNYGRKELGLEPTDSAVARAEYIAMVDNQVLPMLRDTFGAQFTVVEGETLRKTLGDPDKAPAEKKAVLKAFIEQKRRNIEAQAQQGGIAPPVQEEVYDAQGNRIQ